MERLTHRRSDGSAYTELDMQTCLNRLADYEDNGKELRIMDKEDMNKLFNIVTEVGMAQAIDVLHSIHDNQADQDGTFIDGFDYAITALQKAKELVEEKDERAD